MTTSDFLYLNEGFLTKGTVFRGFCAALFNCLLRDPPRTCVGLAADGQGLTPSMYSPEQCSAIPVTTAVSMSCGERRKVGHNLISAGFPGLFSTQFYVYEQWLAVKGLIRRPGG